MNYVSPRSAGRKTAWRVAFPEDRPGHLRQGRQEARQEIERQESFLSELRDFEDKLRRAANLHLEPDLNDGVVLNIAPLWELVPWKEAKAYWEDLLEGEYEWSSIGKQLAAEGGRLLNQAPQTARSSGARLSARISQVRAVLGSSRP